MKGLIPESLNLAGSLILLKPSSPADYPSLRTILSDLKSMEQLKYMAHLDQGGWTLEEVAKRHEAWRQKQKEQTCIDFVVFDRATGQILGNCGFTRIDLSHKNAEFGLILHHSTWGKGISAECHLLCLDYAFSILKLHRIEFGTFTTNTRMRTFFEKVGIPFESIKRGCFFDEGTFKDDAVYALFSEQWQTVKRNLEIRIEAQRK
jgi:ribosomal-protein-alanine N-acetyltransferase